MADRNIEVYAKNNIYIKVGVDVVKIKKGTVTKLSKAEVAHFKGKVTKDIPEEAEG